MKSFFNKISQVTDQYNIFDIGVLKICLLALGILIGVYFTAFFESLQWLLWTLFILSWLYIVIKTFGVYWQKTK